MTFGDTPTAPGIPVIEAENLKVVFDGRKIIDIPSLSIFPNEVLAVIGPNGSGKTTVMLALASLLKTEKDSRISYWGQRIADGPELLNLRRRFAVLFQEPLLLAGTVWDNVTVGLGLRGVPKAEMISRAKTWMERFGISGLAKRQVRTLSGGEAKRVSLARAFVLKPEILFLDEPFTALDSPTRAALLEDFTDVLRETRVTTFMVTHDRNEALILADRVAVILRGELRQVGTPQEVFSRPVDEEVANFIEVGNVLRGTVVSKDQGITTVAINNVNIDAVSDAEPGTGVTMFLRQDDITLSLPPQLTEVTSALNRLPGKITRVLPAGSLIRVTVDCGFPLISVVTTRSYEEMGLAPGKTVISIFKATAVQLIKKN